ncbi:protein FAM166C B-like [Actinia tenebrosa]|uniref:Ciliary microtubule inner protein 2C n=1 Tax=Actinia tenebrosa TaxID=6105 RepID=A0A6P8J3C5_ACTTE|nr:protein FAM166C B-like [Actinia tenebrosa]
MSTFRWMLLRLMYVLPRSRRYAGFRPQYKWRYGDTFGNDTAKYFQQKRSLTLTSYTAKDSGMGWDTKVQLPSVYSNVPDLVLGARARDGNRMLAPIKYTLLNHHDRDEDIRDFLKKVQDHRCQYVDSSGTLPRVDYFVLPTKNDIKSFSTTRCGDDDLR